MSIIDIINEKLNMTRVGLPEVIVGKIEMLNRLVAVYTMMRADSEFDLLTHGNWSSGIAVPISVDVNKRTITFQKFKKVYSKKTEDAIIRFLDGRIKKYEMLIRTFKDEKHNVR